MFILKKKVYTGEISANMLCSVGVEYCIVGHSERRTIFNESNEDVNKKVKCLIENIKPILCVGETLEERNSGVFFDKIKTQIIDGLLDVNLEDIKKKHSSSL